MASGLGSKQICGLIGLTVCLITCGSCQSDRTQGSRPAKPLVVCTTTMIADLARQIGGDDVQVVAIMKPGVDPHIYDPTPEDSIWFRKADLVLVNGLHLEGKMMDMIAGVGAKAVELAEHPGIEIRKKTSQAAPDPHVWWDARNFKRFAEQVRDALKRIVPAGAPAFEQRATAYIARLDAVDAAIRRSIGTIPEPRRYMVTSHDAFYYYGAAYGLDVDAVLGISTDAQANAGEQGRLAQIVAKRKIPAIFHETSVSAAQNQLVDGIRRLVKEKFNHEVKIAGPLHSDSLGNVGSGAETYIDAILSNTRMIVEALGGEFVAPTTKPTD